MKKVKIYPWDDSNLENRIFERNDLYPLLINYKDSNPFKKLKEQCLNKYNIELDTIEIGKLDEADLIIFFDMPSNRNKIFKECIEKRLYGKMALFIWEPEVVKIENYNLNKHEYFRYIFTMCDDFIDEKRYFKFYYMQPLGLVNPFQTKWKQKKFCCLISGNKKSKVGGELYSERIRAIEYFEKKYNEQFDLYGIGWDEKKFFNRIKIKTKTYKSYKGIADIKLKEMSKYKYCICYENQNNLNGYITEKIFDCFISGCIPIYYGAPNITEYIPQGCFVDKRKYKTYEELTAYLDSITEQQYNEILDNINTFMSGEKAKKFSEQYFVDNVSKKINEIIQKVE